MRRRRKAGRLVIPISVFLFTLLGLHVIAGINKASAAGDPVIAAAGDIACGAGSAGAACKQPQTADLVTAINPDAVLVLGDNQYEQGSLVDFQNYYDKTWGKFKSVTFPSVGNHEYLTSGAAGYFDYFNGVGTQSGPAGDRSKGYYAYNLGTWRLYALNSNCSAAGGCNAGSPQEVWLRSDLAANPRACILAYYHHPLFTSGSRGGESHVQDLYTDLYSAHADVILAGHEHNYERFAPQNVNALADPKGITEFVVGTGGRNFTLFTHMQANSVARSDNTFGVLKMILHPGSYDFSFLPVSGSTFTDSGSISCGTGGVIGTGTTTPTPSVVAATSLPGDLDGNRKVDIFDYNIMVTDFGRTGAAGFTAADIDRNGNVDIFDYNILVTNFGRSI